MSKNKSAIAVLAFYFLTLICFSFAYAGNGPKVKADAEPSNPAEVSSAAPVPSSSSGKNIYLYTGERLCLNDALDGVSVKNIKWSGDNIDSGIFSSDREGTFAVSAVDADSGNKIADLTVNVFVPDKAEKKEYRVYVYKRSQTVVVYDKNENGEYNVPVKIMLCSTGDPTSETKTGDYTIKNNYRWRLLKGPSYGQYASSFSGSYLFHSMPYDAMDEKTMWDNSYELLGTKSSHGCVRLALIDTKWIYDHVAIGSHVKVLDDSCKYIPPTPVLYSEEDRYMGWDPTDIADNNPYKIDGISPAPAVHLPQNEKKVSAGESFSLGTVGSAKIYSYSSNNSKVATVDSEGYVTTHESGKCTIYVMGDDGGDTRMTLTVE